MLTEAFVGPPYQLLVEAPLAGTGLVARCQQDCSPPRIECEGDTPSAPRRLEAKLLPVGEAGSVERIDARAPQGRPEGLEQPCMGEQFILNRLGQVVELGGECPIELDDPAHAQIMPRSA